jgi:aminoglycoside 2'-N-acetyltransferase I
LALRTGYVEGVAVRADQRRRGYGRFVLVGLDRVVRGGHELGALSAGPDAGRIYESLGWQRWRGATWCLTPEGIRRTPDDDNSTYVLELHHPLDLDGDLACDWRDGDVW